MRIVIVTRKFFPYGDATSGVVGNLAEALIDLGCEVNIVAVSDVEVDEKFSKWNGIDVSFIVEKGVTPFSAVKKGFKRNPILFFGIILVKCISKIERVINRRYRRLSLDPSYVRAYKKVYKKLNCDFDLCMITLMPQEAVWTAYNEFDDLSKVAVYQLDTYWDNEMLPVKHSEFRRDFEIKLAKECRFFLTTPQIKYINTEIDSIWGENLIPVEFPIIKKHVIDYSRVKCTDKLHCVFLGTLYPDIRPPELIVSILSKITIKNVIFDFYGSNQNLIENSVNYKDAKERVVLHGMVSSEEADKVRNESDVLINIDNICSNQVPSKIFEYINTGKPIINFYFNKDSHVLKYLSLYPLSINVCVYDDIQYNCELIDRFINGLNGELVSYSLIEDIFMKNTPEYVAKQCIEAYRNSEQKERKTI